MRSVARTRTSTLGTMLAALLGADARPGRATEDV
jgi:hypothetical protein